MSCFIFNLLQDMRKFGSLVLQLPKTYSFILLGSLSLMAFPFLTGFYSKDFLLELALVPRNITSTVAYVLALLAAVLTATYSARLMIMTFFSEPHFSNNIIKTIHDPSLYMYIPLFILGLGAAFFGYLAHEVFLGMGSTFYSQALFFHPANPVGLLDGSFSPNSIYVTALKYLPLTTLLILLTLLPLTYNPSKYSSHSIPQTSSNSSLTSSGIPSLLPSSPTLWYRTFGLPSTTLNHFNIYYYWFLVNILTLSAIINRYLDRGLLELLGPLGLVRLFHYYAFKLELLATAFIPHYAFLILIFTFATVVGFALSY